MLARRLSLVNVFVNVYYSMFKAGLLSQRTFESNESNRPMTPKDNENITTSGVQELDKKEGKATSHPIETP